MGDKTMKTCKKILAFALSIGCIGSMTACDINALLDSLKGGITDLSAMGNSGPVTKEEWDALMDGVVNAENVTMRLTFQYDGGADGLKTMIDTYKCTTNAYECREDGNNHNPLSYEMGEKVGSEYYFYVKNYEGILERWILPDEDEYAFRTRGLFYNLGNYKEIYSQLSYDEEKRVYVGENILTYDIHGKDNVPVDYMEVKIEGRNLTFDMDYHNQKGKIEVYDYDKTVITAPTDYVETSGIL